MKTAHVHNNAKRIHNNISFMMPVICDSILPSCVCVYQKQRMISNYIRRGEKWTKQKTKIKTKKSLTFCY